MDLNVRRAQDEIWNIGHAWFVCLVLANIPVVRMFACSCAEFARMRRMKRRSGDEEEKEGGERA